MQLEVLTSMLADLAANTPAMAAPPSLPTNAAPARAGPGVGGGLPRAPEPEHRPTATSALSSISSPGKTTGSRASCSCARLKHISLPRDVVTDVHQHWAGRWCTVACAPCTRDMILCEWLVSVWTSQAWGSSPAVALALEG